MGQKKRKRKKGKPDILFMMVDEERFPSVYETAELKDWRKKHLVTHELLK